MLGVAQPEHAGDDRAPVAALRAVARVAEPPHQRREGVGDAPRAPAARARRLGEAVAGQRRADHVEGVLAAASVRLGVAQRLDHVEELDDRARPAVRDQQRQRIRVSASARAGSGCAGRRCDVRKCVQRVELALGRAPVVDCRASTRTARARSRARRRSPSPCPRSGRASESPRGAGAGRPRQRRPHGSRSARWRRTGGSRREFIHSRAEPATGTGPRRPDPAP